jgi:heme A synthase
MRLYRIVAYLIAAEVAVQAALVAFGMAGLGRWVEDGGVATKATFEEGNDTVTGAAGFVLHGENGALYIPLLALAFLVVAVFTRRSVQGGIRWAAIVLGLVVVQVALGFGSLAVYGLAALHGINALALLLASIHAGNRARPTASSPAAPDQAHQFQP